MILGGGAAVCLLLSAHRVVIFVIAQLSFLYLGSAADAETRDVNVNDGETELMTMGSVSQQSSSYSESDFVLMASLQLGALRTLGSLLGCSKYIELLLVPRDSSGGEKQRSSRQDTATGQDDLQVD